MTNGKGTHTVTFDHAGCNHLDPENWVCEPDATFACIAPPGDYCRFGCVEDPCSETGWTRSPTEPDKCDDYGHPLVDHDCWALAWLEASDATETYADVDTIPDGFIFHDGPIDIVEWDEDYLVWAYPAT